MRAVLAILLSCFAVTCAPSGGVHLPQVCESSLTSGTIASPNVSFAAQSQAVIYRCQNPDCSVKATQIIISAAENACLEDALEERGPTPSDMHTLQLFINDAHVGMIPLWTGTDPSVSPNWVTVAFRPAGTAASARGASTIDFATSGAVTIAELDTTRVTGTYDVAFQGGMRLQGAFDALTCNPKLCP